MEVREKKTFFLFHPDFFSSIRVEGSELDFLIMN